MKKSITYDAAVTQWESERVALGYVQPYSAKKSAQKARLFSPWIGSTTINKISTATIRQAMVALSTTGGRAHQGLSSATLRAAHLAGTQAINFAIQQNAAASNPFNEIKRPKANYRQSQFLTEPQAARLAAQMQHMAQASMRASNVTQTSFAIAVCIALATGLRRGEVFALDWNHVNLVTMRISVARAVKGDGTIGTPKSASGIRSVAIGSGLCNLLTQAKAWQQQATPRVTNINSELLIIDETGNIASLNKFEHWWRKWADQNGWPGLRFHELRHTHATLLIAGGADVKTVQMRLGHSSAEITMSCYAHAIPLSDNAAASTLDTALFK